MPSHRYPHSLDHPHARPNAEATARMWRRGTVTLLALIALAFVPTALAQSVGTLRIGINQLATSMDPPTDWIVESTWIHMNVFDCLVWRNRDTAAFEPWLATSVENVSDTVWRVALREGVTFHNGEPFDADAVVWTYRRILDDPTMLVYNQWTFISDIRVVDDFTIEIETRATEPAFLSRMAGTGCGIQAPDEGRRRAEAGEPYQPIGTGPYMLERFEPEDRVVLAANPDYWRGAPGIERLEWTAMPEPITRTSALIAGQADVIVAVSPQDVAAIEVNSGTMTLNFFTNRVMLLSLRAGPSEQYPDWEGPTSDVRVRQAIQYAIDRRTLQLVLTEDAIPVLARTFPPTLGWDPEMYDNYGDYDPERARQLLAEAGYDGEPVVFHAAPQTPYSADAAQVIGAMLEAVGINVSVQVLATPTFREQIDFPYRNQELVMNILNNSFFDPWIEVLAQRSDRRERSGWTGPAADRADELIRAAETNMDPESRAEQIREVNRIFYDEAILIHLFRVPETLGLIEALDWEPAPDGFLWFGNASLR